MKFPLALLLCLQLLLCGCATNDGHKFNEVIVVFTAKEVQEAIDKAPKFKPLTSGLVVVTLEGSPTVKLGEPKGRITLAVRIAIQVVGAPPITAGIKCSAKLTYVEAQKAFFLESPSVDAVEAPYLPKMFEGVAINLANQQVAKAVTSTPVYVMPEEGSLKQRLARKLLKTVEVKPDQVVATFAL